MASHGFLTRRPLVGGEPADLIVQIIRSFPVTAGPLGDLIFENTATGERLAAFTRAYEQIELQVLAREAHCSHRFEHKTLDVEQYRSIMLRELMHEAKKALGTLEDFDPLWP